MNTGILIGILVVLLLICIGVVAYMEISNNAATDTTPPSVPPDTTPPSIPTDTDTTPPNVPLTDTTPIANISTPPPSAPVVTKPVVTKPVVTAPVVTVPLTKPVVTAPVVTAPVVTAPVVTVPLTKPVVNSIVTGMNNLFGQVGSASANNGVVKYYPTGTTLSTCETACLNDPTCNTWVSYGPTFGGGYANNCFGSSTKPTPTAQGNVTSGTVTGR